MAKLYKVENKEVVFYIFSENPSSALETARNQMKIWVSSSLDKDVNISLLCNEKDILRS